MGMIKDVKSNSVALIGAFGLLATLSATLPALADGPVTLWYQRGANPEQQRILQKDLVEPYNAAHPKDPLTLDVRAGSNGDKQIRMAVVSGKGPDIVMTPGPSTMLRTGEYQGHNYALPRTFETM